MRYSSNRYGSLFRRWLTGQCQSPRTRVPASASSTLDYSRQELTGQSQPTNKGLMNRRADSRDACTTIPFRSDGRSFGRSVCSRRRGKGARSAPARGSPFVAPAEICVCYFFHFYVSIFFLYFYPRILHPPKVYLSKCLSPK